MIRNYSNTAAQSTLTASIGATDTSISLAGYAGDPTPPFTATLARGTATEEIVLVTAVIGSTVTVTRGFDGTSAQAQAAGATFQEVVIALDFREANNHVNATGAVHGVGSQLVGVSDTQTLTNKTLTAPQVSALTGTGTTTLAATNITTLAVSGAATLVTLNVSGAATFTGAVTIPSLELSTQLELDQLAAQPSVIAGKQQLWGKTDGGLYVGANRLATHWGSGTSFPAGAAAGDTFFYTGACLMQYNGSGWRQAEDFAVATVTARGAIPAGVLHPGFRVTVTAQNQEHVWDGSVWRGTKALPPQFASHGALTLTPSQSPFTLASISIADPGFPYLVEALARSEGGSTAAGTRWDTTINVVQGATTSLAALTVHYETNAFTQTATGLPVGGSGNSGAVPAASPFTGAATVTYVTNLVYGAANASYTQFNNAFSVRVVPA